MIKKTMSVNLELIDDEYRPICKKEMTSHEIGVLGIVVLKHKLAKLKERFRRK